MTAPGSKHRLIGRPIGDGAQAVGAGKTTAGTPDAVRYSERYQLRRVAEIPFRAVICSSPP